MNLSEILTPEKINTIKEIATAFPNTVFCGSLGLVLNGKLNRQVGDLDIITDENWFNPSEDQMKRHTDGFLFKYRIPPGSDNCTSHIFMVGLDTVTCWKMDVSGLKVDVMYNQDTKPEWTTINFFGVTIKVEIPDSAINAKLGYVIHDKLSKSATKHLKDLIRMNVDKNRIIKALDESFIFGNYDKSKYKGVDQIPDIIFEDDDLPF